MLKEFAAVNDARMTEEPVLVSDFYKNQSILITGGGGSLGQVLIEKLLRSCPEITTIYLILRPKQHKGSTTSAAERLTEITNTPLFSKIREEKPRIFDKIVVVNGDLAKPSIGISKSDADTLINKVSIVFHLASVLKFDATLKESLSSNAVSSLQFLQLCRQMQKIKAFVYVSTLYSTCNNRHIDERLPVIPCLNGIVDYEKIDVDELLKLIPNDLEAKWPNTYTLSKAITEIMINNQKDSLPVSIVRPSIITSTLREPFPGWIDNLYGPTYMILMILIGCARTAIGNENKISDIIPSDIVVNLLICAAWKIATEKNGELKIYNCASGKRNPILWGQLIPPSEKFARIYPSLKMVRYPYVLYTKYVPLYWLYKAIQSYVIIYMHRLTTGSSKMLRIEQSISRYFKLIHFFSQREWTINDDNVVDLQEELNATDKNKFSFDVESINWPQYVKNYVTGIRVHILKDSMDDGDEAHAHLKRLWWREIFIQVFLLLLMIGSGYVIMNMLIPILAFAFRNGVKNSSIEL